jgi:arginase
VSLHISFDVDALDPTYVSSTGTRVDDGLTPLEVRSIIEESLVQDSLVSLDVVEFNPALGNPIESMKSVQEVFMI